MGKSDLRTWEAVIRHARERAKGSLKRKDPIAWAYWCETEVFANSCAVSYRHPGSWHMGAFDCVQKAKMELKNHGFMKAALWYSRAKWFVIVARANGMVMNPRKTGVNLKWLSGAKKEVRDAIARPVAAGY